MISVREWLRRYGIAHVFSARELASQMAWSPRPISLHAMLTMRITTLRVKVQEFRCVRRTSGPGNDEVELLVHVTAEDGKKASARYAIDEVKEGLVVPMTDTLELDATGSWVVVVLLAQEVDFTEGRIGPIGPMVTGRVSLGPAAARIGGLRLLRSLSLPEEMEHVLQGDGGEYRVKTTLSAS